MPYAFVCKGPVYNEGVEIDQKGMQVQITPRLVLERGSKGHTISYKAFPGFMAI